MQKIIALISFCLLCSYAIAAIDAPYCEKHVGKYAEKYFLTKERFGDHRAIATTVTITNLMTTVVISGQRYKTVGQAHISYPGTTGGEVRVVKRFEAEIEDGSPRPAFVYFRKVKES